MYTCKFQMPSYMTLYLKVLCNHGQIPEGEWLYKPDRPNLPCYVYMYTCIVHVESCDYAPPPFCILAWGKTGKFFCSIVIVPLDDHYRLMNATWAMRSLHFLWLFDLFPYCRCWRIFDPIMPFPYNFIHFFFTSYCS
jgi:hypothetical protein